MLSAETARRALIVVDVQNEYDKDGDLAIEYPPFDQSLPNVLRAMEAATAAGIKVVVVKQLAPSSSPIFAAGTHGGELHPEIATRHRDHYVEKRLPSAFAGTDLEYWLRSNGIETVTIAGYMTHNCDLATIVHAVHMGFAVETLSDATGSVPYANKAGSATAEEIHHVMMVVMQSRFAAVASTAEWIDSLASGAPLERDSIAASHDRALALRTAA